MKNRHDIMFENTNLTLYIIIKYLTSFTLVNSCYIEISIKMFTSTELNFEILTITRSRNMTFRTSDSNV